MAEERLDYRAAMLTCAFVNSNRGKKSKAAKISDFMPKREPRKQAAKQAKRQTIEQQLEMARQITLAFGGTIKQKSKN